MIQIRFKKWMMTIFKRAWRRPEFFSIEKNEGIDGYGQGWWNWQLGFWSVDLILSKKMMVWLK